MKILIYKALNGTEPFTKFVNSLADQYCCLIWDRINRIAHSKLLGDFKNIGSGLFELRFHCGCGYRVYFSYFGKDKMVLLNAGKKSTQIKDIKKAKEYLRQFLEKNNLKKR